MGQDTPDCTPEHGTDAAPQPRDPKLATPGVGREARIDRTRPEHPRPDWSLIRPYQPADRDAVRRICCVTAFRNAGARAVFGDERLCADYFSQYYTDVEPDLSYVAEIEGRPVGYLFGCLDARRYTAVMARRIGPSVAARAIGHVARGRHRDSSLRRYLWWALAWSWRESLPVSFDDFPGHYHVNVLPEAQNQELYSRFCLVYLRAFEARGGSGIHGLLTEREHGGAFDRIVRRYGSEYPEARVLKIERPTQFGRIVLGTAVAHVNRAFCFRNEDFRRLMEWGGPRYGF